MGQLRRYKAEYPFKLLVMVGDAEHAVHFTPFHDEDNDDVNAAIDKECEEYLKTGRIKIIREEKLKKEAKVAAQPAAKTTEEPTDLSKIHGSTLYKMALDKGYSGSRKKVDILEFLQNPEE